MKNIILLICISTNICLANYTVGRPLQHIDKSCGVLLYTFLADFAVGHPIITMPKYIQVSKDNNVSLFTYKQFNSGEGIITTTFQNLETAEKLLMIDRCNDGEAIVNCLVDPVTNCAFRENIL